MAGFRVGGPEGPLEGGSQARALLIGEPVAWPERGGIVRSLTQWVLATALKEAESWPEAAGGHAVNVAVNISGAQLADGLTVDDVRGALKHRACRRPGSCWR